MDHFCPTNMYIDTRAVLISHLLSSATPIMFDETLLVHEALSSLSQLCDSSHLPCDPRLLTTLTSDPIANNTYSRVG
jgi:hypothetical protein